MLKLETITKYIKTFPRRNCVQNLARLKICTFHNCLKGIKTLQIPAYDQTSKTSLEKVL